MKYLDSIHGHDDIRRLSIEELNELAEEIRQYLIEHVSKTGGHLASNLGVVELTLAIHNVYDSTADRILFDVGHQSYVHKLLTGRMASFDTLRSFGGLSGFTKPSESCSDAFTAGHASTSLSTALGMARARTLMHEDYRVISVIGDGSSGGGVFFEGLNDAGASGEPLVVVLNDNGMSISQNVGELSRHLSRLRLKPGYFNVKRWYRKLMQKLPFGKALYDFTHRVKEKIRKGLLGTTIFEEMGFLYLGPVDGHDIRELSFLLSVAKDEKRPVLIHAVTKKGKGYSPAEDHPSEYHSVGKFDPASGTDLNKAGNSFSVAMGSCLTWLAENNTRICAITAGMKQGTGLTAFSEAFPERFFDVGIAEEHAVSMAAGMAKQGMIPVVCVYSTFLQRAYDMILQDVGIQKLHVVFCVDRCGLVGEDGETHHGVFDVGYLSQVPGITIFSPGCYRELERDLRFAVLDCTGPVVVRYPRGKEKPVCIPQEQNVIPGRTITLISYGINSADVCSAAGMLREQGIASEVILMDRIKPADFSSAIASIRKTGHFIFAEEQNSSACIGNLLVKELYAEKVPSEYRLLNLGDCWTQHGDVNILRRNAGLDAEGIVKAAKEVLALEK